MLLASVRYLFRSTWDQHIASGPWVILLTCVVCNLVLCFGEYFFHRYLLHLETVRFLRTLCASHLTHHKLTSIRFDDAGGKAGCTTACSAGSGASCTAFIKPITPTTSAT